MAVKPELPFFETQYKLPVLRQRGGASTPTANWSDMLTLLFQYTFKSFSSGRGQNRVQRKGRGEKMDVTDERKCLSLLGPLLL